MKIRLAFFFVGLMSACSPDLTVTLQPIPQTVNIAITPATTPIGEALQVCAANNAGMNLNVIALPPDFIDLDDVDLAFQLGQPNTLPAFAAPIALDRVVVILHATNPINILSNQELQDLFAGRVTNWSQLGGNRQNVEIWIALEGDETRVTFDNIILEANLISPIARLAPNPEVMLESIADDPGAIGYLPQSWLTEAVKLIDLDIELPVLALAVEEPDSPVRELLVCLLGEMGQRSLGSRYFLIND